MLSLYNFSRESKKFAERTVFLLLSLFFLSCNSNYKDLENDRIRAFEISDFQSSTKVTGEHFGPLHYFQQPGACMLLRDSILLVCDATKEKLLHFVNLKTGELITSFGNIGPGPGEMDDLGIFPSIFVNPEATHVDLLEPRKRRFASYQIDSLLSGSNTYFPEKFITTPPEVGSPLGLVKVNDSIYIGNSSAPCARLFSWNRIQDEITCSPTLVDSSRNFNEGILSQLNYQVIAVRPDKKFVVSAMYHYNRIDLFDLKLNQRISIVGGQSSMPMDNCRMNEGSVRCNWKDIKHFYGPGIYTTNNYIYVMYKKPIKSQPQELIDFESEVHVFDWEGNPVKRVALGMFLYDFVVDEKTNTLYALDYLYYEEHGIVRFSIGNLGT